MKPIVISLFDLTGNILKPWQSCGYECHIYDIQHPPGRTVREDGMICWGVDLSTTPDEIELSGGKAAFLACFPPCTHLAVSGSRWMAGKGLRALQESIAFFATCAEVAESLDCAYFIENPMSTISTYWRSPDYKFHPCHYSRYVGGEDFYTKETWLWTGGGFIMPPRDMHNDMFDEPDKTYIRNQPPGPERANIRSATAMGFANAVFLSNSGADKCIEVIAGMNA